MFRLIKFTFKMVITLKLMAIAFSAGMGMAYLMQLREQYRSWGLVDGGDERGVRGDALVAEADLVETRAVDIDAAPDRVWPWLAQLGYGRGGWYSFNAIDRPWTPGGGSQGESAEEILPEFQDLAEGDLVPTASSAGFEARIVEPGEALVLFLDDAMIREQVSEIVAEAADAVEERGGRLELDAADFEVPPYEVTLAFELQELPGGRTRLIERVRAHIEASDNQWRARPVLAMGLFVFLRSQLLGIKRRAEGVEEA